MSHLTPSRVDGTRKPESEYSPEEKASIAREIYRAQLTRHTLGQAVDAGALRMAATFATEGEDPGTAVSCAALIEEPQRPVPPLGTAPLRQIWS